MKRVAGLVCAVVALSVPAASGAFDGKPVYVVASCAGHALRPRAIDISCGDGPPLRVTGIRYASYGGEEASGRGVLHDGSRVIRAQLILYEIARCAAGRLYYTHVRLQYARVDFESLIEPDERCVILDGVRAA